MTASRYTRAREMAGLSTLVVARRPVFDGVQAMRRTVPRGECSACEFHLRVTGYPCLRHVRPIRRDERARAAGTTR